MTCITVVDDSHVDRMLVAGLLKTNPDFHIGLAENGREALDKIADAPPDLVITDLIMPAMNGLVLVREMRRRFPQIPVILMTAHGNESIAVQSLQAGAASYVAKARQAEQLMETIDRVMARAEAERNRARLADCVSEFQCKFSLDNDPALIRPLMDEIQQRMAGAGVGDCAERVRTAIAVEEAILNAMYHGNLEISARDLVQGRASRTTGRLTGRLTRLVEQRRGLPKFRRRKIGVEVWINRECARFVIRDEGNGFDRRATDASNVRECFENGHGRGMMLIRSLMDEVAYNGAGNEVMMVKNSG